MKAICGKFQQIWDLSKKGSDTQKHILLRAQTNELHVPKTCFDPDLNQGSLHKLLQVQRLTYLATEALNLDRLIIYNPINFQLMLQQLEGKSHNLQTMKPY